MSRTWLVVADGSRAKVFETMDRGSGLADVADLTRSIDVARSGELSADRPGRTFDSVGPGRHAMESPTDPHRHMKREFARTIVEDLRDALFARRFDHLILIAPPAFLGDLRSLLPKEIKARLADEIASDLTTLPSEELIARLMEILGQGS